MHQIFFCTPRICLNDRAVHLPSDAITVLQSLQRIYHPIGLEKYEWERPAMVSSIHGSLFEHDTKFGSNSIILWHATGCKRFMLSIASQYRNNLYILDAALPRDDVRTVPTLPSITSFRTANIPYVYITEPELDHVLSVINAIPMRYVNAGDAVLGEPPSVNWEAPALDAASPPRVVHRLPPAKPAANAQPPRHPLRILLLAWCAVVAMFMLVQFFNAVWRGSGPWLGRLLPALQYILTAKTIDIGITSALMVVGYFWATSNLLSCLWRTQFFFSLLVASCSMALFFIVKTVYADANIMVFLVAVALGYVAALFIDYDKSRTFYMVGAWCIIFVHYLTLVGLPWWSPLIVVLLVLAAIGAEYKIPWFRTNVVRRMVLPGGVTDPPVVENVIQAPLIRIGGQRAGVAKGAVPLDNKTTIKTLRERLKTFKDEKTIADLRKKLEPKVQSAEEIELARLKLTNKDRILQTKLLNEQVRDITTLRKHAEALNKDTRNRQLEPFRDRYNEFTRATNEGLDELYDIVDSVIAHGTDDNIKHAIAHVKTLVGIDKKIQTQLLKVLKAALGTNLADVIEGINEPDAESEEEGNGDDDADGEEPDEDNDGGGGNEEAENNEEAEDNGGGGGNEDAENNEEEEDNGGGGAHEEEEDNGDGVDEN